MKLLLPLILVTVLLSGCQPKPPSDSNGSQHVGTPTRTAAKPGHGARGSDQTIVPLGSNIGPMTPVGGGENLGAGPSGGLTNAAKDRARSVASESSKTTSVTDTNE